MELFRAGSIFRPGIAMPLSPPAARRSFFRRSPAPKRMFSHLWMASSSAAAPMSILPFSAMTPFTPRPMASMKPATPSSLPSPGSAYERDVPVLGICRGIQLLNVALGGTLIQHVPDLTEIEHRQNTTEIPPQTGIHAVELVPGSIVAGVYGAETLQTNSFHHQALKDVAAPFEVSGRSADGMIEAVEANEKGCFFAVQWHPEMMHAHDTLQLAPFTRLVEKSSSRRLAATGD